MKNLKKLLLAVIMVVAITHRHEDYCSDHPHGATGKEGNAYIFGPWLSTGGVTKEKINHTTTNPDTIQVPRID